MMMTGENWSHAKASHACERSVNQCLHKDYLIKQTTKLSAFLTDIVFIIHSAIDFN